MREVIRYTCHCIHVTGFTGNLHAERSAALFNNRHLVAVVSAVAQVRGSDGFTTRMIASKTDLPDSLVRPVIHRLLAAGVFEELHRGPGSRGAKYFCVTKHNAWTELKALCRALSQDHS
jgi:hypothetical protein